MTTQRKTAPRFLKRSAVQELTTLSTSELYRRMAAGEFPSQIKLGARAVAWLESDILEWMEQQIAENREAGA